MLQGLQAPGGLLEGQGGRCRGPCFHGSRNGFSGGSLGIRNRRPRLPRIPQDHISGAPFSLPSFGMLGMYVCVSDSAGPGRGGIGLGETTGQRRGYAILKPTPAPGGPLALYPAAALRAGHGYRRGVPLATLTRPLPPTTTPCVRGTVRGTVRGRPAGPISARYGDPQKEGGGTSGRGATPKKWQQRRQPKQSRGRNNGARPPRRRVCFAVRVSFRACGNTACVCVCASPVAARPVVRLPACPRGSHVAHTDRVTQQPPSPLYISPGSIWSVSNAFRDADSRDVNFFRIWLPSCRTSLPCIGLPTASPLDFADPALSSAVAQHGRVSQPPPPAPPPPRRRGPLALLLLQAVLGASVPKGLTGNGRQPAAVPAAN